MLSVLLHNALRISALVMAFCWPLAIFMPPDQAFYVLSAVWAGLVTLVPFVEHHGMYVLAIWYYIRAHASLASHTMPQKNEREAGVIQRHTGKVSTERHLQTRASVNSTHYLKQQGTRSIRVYHRTPSITSHTNAGNARKKAYERSRADCRAQQQKPQWLSIAGKVVAGGVVVLAAVIIVVAREKSKL
jgi:hypothetical protein